MRRRARGGTGVVRNRHRRHNACSKNRARQEATRARSSAYTGSSRRISIRARHRASRACYARRRCVKDRMRRTCLVDLGATNRVRSIPTDRAPSDRAGADRRRLRGRRARLDLDVRAARRRTRVRLARALRPVSHRAPRANAHSQPQSTRRSADRNRLPSIDMDRGRSFP